MTNHRRLGFILPAVLWLIPTALAAKLYATPVNCDATTAVSKIIAELPYPEDWTVIVACDKQTWERLQRKGDAQGTRTAFTNLKGRVTVVNGDYVGHPDLSRPVSRVLRHELGHVVCKCGDENTAEKF